jgi:hypothetical protein
MHSKSARATVCAGMALLGILFAGCEKGYRQIVVVDGNNAELITWGPAPQEPQELWARGRTVIFRTDSDFPGSPKKASGKAGRVYRINDNYELEEVGEFALTVPNDTLAYQFGK